MSDPKAVRHTPGPWHVHEGGNFVKVGAAGYDEYVEEHSYLGGPLCVASVNRDATDDHGPNHELAMANARLIAAAPDLLAILRVLVEHAQERYPHFESERGQTEIALALRLIAKAEGAV